MGLTVDQNNEKQTNLSVKLAFAFSQTKETDPTSLTVFRATVKEIHFPGINI